MGDVNAIGGVVFLLEMQALQRFAR